MKFISELGARWLSKQTASVTSLSRHIGRDIRDHAYRLAHYHERVITIRGVKISTRHRAISPHVFHLLRRGAYEKREARQVAKYLTPDDRVLEVGGGIGFVALTCIKSVGIQHYHIVEANPSLVPLIQRNLALNGVDYKAVPVENLAAAPQSGTVLFSLHRNLCSSSVNERFGSIKQIPVRSETLHSIARRMRFHPNVLVMDIEGGEVDLEPEEFAMFEKILVELHPRIVGHDRISILQQSLIQKGFANPENGVFLRKR